MYFFSCSQYIFFILCTQCLNYDVPWGFSVLGLSIWCPAHSLYLHGCVFPQFGDFFYHHDLCEALIYATNFGFFSLIYAYSCLVFSQHLTRPYKFLSCVFTFFSQPLLIFTQVLYLLVLMLQLLLASLYSEGFPLSLLVERVSQSIFISDWGLNASVSL